MKMYAARSNFAMSAKTMFGELIEDPILPPSYAEYIRAFAYVTSWKVMKELVCRYLMSLDEFETKAMQGIDGVIFKGDASHKVTKLVYVNTDEKVYHGLYTLMNEFGEIIGWWFIRTGKMEELEEMIRKLRKRYLMHNFTRPQIVYSDRPEMDRSIWERIWPSIQPDSNVSSIPCNPGNVAYLTFPPDVGVPTVIYNANDCSAIIYSIREKLDRDEGEKVIGFDLEWNRGNNPAAIIQICLRSGISFVFSLKSLLGKR